MLTEAQQLAAILQGAAFAPITDRAFLRITGTDATRWLNGMVTNSIQALAPGEGCYNFLLNAQGRIQGDCTIYRDPDSERPEFLLETHSSQLLTVQNTLDRFIIMDDVELASALYLRGDKEAHAGLVLLGPEAPQLLADLLGSQSEVSPSAAPRPGTMMRGFANGAAVAVLASNSEGAPSYEVWCSDQAEAGLLTSAISGRAVPVSPTALEALRVLSGAPLFGVDIRDRDLPRKTAQTHALHFSKGCYLGQEIVERIRSRGQVHRQFTRFKLDGALPELPCPLQADGKPAGELTSAALVPLPEGPALLALGYVRREFLETGASLTYPGGTTVPASARSGPRS